MISDRIEILSRKKITDKRGWFLKVINGKESNLPNYTGEFYITSAKPRESKGGHYHLKANEWFTLIKGDCKLILEDILSKENLVILLSSESPKTIFVPFGIAHIFVNDSVEEFILTAYSDKLYEPDDTITYFFKS